jgi:hypothetical protein
LLELYLYTSLEYILSIYRRLIRLAEDYTHGKLLEDYL